MIQLTEKVIAVEVPNDSNVQEFSVTENNRKQIMDDCTKKGKDTKVLIGDISLIGVTPLSEEQWREVVKTEVVGIYDEDDNIERYDYLYKNYSNPRGYNKLTATESGLSLLESKGLDINKKYAIIKIEK